MTATIAPVRPGSSAASKLVRRIGTARETGILIALLLVILAATLANPNFLFSSDGFRDLLLTPSLLLLVAVGQAVVIITRNVDLSVGSIVGLTAYLTGRLFIDFPGLPIVVVFLGGVLLGALLGFINGALVAFARVPALVITLGTMYIYRGINVAWTGSDRIRRPSGTFPLAGHRWCRRSGSSAAPRASIRGRDPVGSASRPRSRSR